jgi:hypothetical protein
MSYLPFFYNNDVEQYPVARCAMNTNIYMHGHSSSSGVEAMNAANK